MSNIASVPQIKKSIPQPQDNPMQKSERMILQFNKSGLQYLTNQKTYAEGFDYFKKAQRAVQQELKITPQSKKINQLAAITYNNLACYYKKVNKPKVALSYLKKALQIQVFKVENWLSTASTHLNICAIYSFTKKHEQACEHAILAIKMLQKYYIEISDPQKSTHNPKQQQQQQKNYNSIRMLSHYNAGIQNQYLKKFQSAQKYYEATIQIASAKNDSNNNHLLIKSCQQGLERVKNQQRLSKQRLVELITKRKQQQTKNNHDWMRKNKKNYHKQGDDWRDLIHNRKYAEYKIQTQHQSTATQTKKNQSVGKLSSIKPVLHTEEYSKRSLHSNTVNKPNKQNIESKQ